MKKPSLIIDTVLTLFASFLLGTLVFGYFLRQSAAIIVSSVTLSLGVTFLSSKIAARRALPARRKKQLREILDKFVFSLPEYAYSFTLAAISDRCAVRECDGLIIAAKTAFLVRLRAEKVSLSRLAGAYALANKHGAKRLVILSARGADAEASRACPLLDSPAAEIWDFDKVYDFFCKLGHPPVERLTLAPKRRRFAEMMSGALDVSRARRYLLSAVVMLVFARFMPYSVFYVAVASVSLTLAILCRINILRILHKR